MPKDKRLHFKDLNALRFFAFIPVFLFCVFYLTRTDNEGFHSEMTNLFEILATNSLDFFFFLSAFLLASHGLREYKYNESFSLKSFYIRRVLRVAPLFIISLLFAFLLHPVIIKILKLIAVNTPSFTDFFIHLPGTLTGFTKEQYIYLLIAWAVYMFIQYYLLIGIILKNFEKHLDKIALAAVIIGIAARIFHHFVDLPFQFDFLSFGVAIGCGLYLAIKVRNNDKLIDRVKNIPKRLIVPLYITGLIVIVFTYLLSDHFVWISVAPLFTSIIFSFIVLEQTFGKNSAVKLRNNKLISHLGKISFGMIIYQSIINVLIVIGIDSLDFEINSVAVKAGFTALSFILSWIVADLSYNFFEKPLLRFRREFKKE